MANELQIPHEIVSLFYMLIQLLISLGLIYIGMWHWLYFVLSVAILSGAYIWFMLKYYRLHADYLNKINQKK